MKNINTWNEIVQQPSCWKEAVEIIRANKTKIDTFFKDMNLQKTKVVFTGAGTSEFVGSCLAPYFVARGINALSLATTDLVSNMENYLFKDDQIILVSFARSGNSPESIATFEKVERFVRKVNHIVITCNKDGKLASLASNRKDALTLILPERTNDLGFAMTSSFSTMGLTAYLVLQVDKIEALANNLTQVANETAAFIASEFSTIEALAKHDFDRVVYLGSGTFKALAQEAHLKVLELTAGETLAFFNSPLGFRHGPKSVVNNRTTIIMFMNQENYKRQYDKDLLEELISQKQYGQIVVVDCLEDQQLSSSLGQTLQFELPNQDEFLISLAYVVVAQMFALARSIAIGKQPDNPWPSGFVNRVVKGVKIH